MTQPAPAWLPEKSQVKTWQYEHVESAGSDQTKPTPAWLLGKS